MTAGKPGIFVYCQKADACVLREICAGIEEEGIPYEIAEIEDDLDALAYQAAADSVLGCGIGIIEKCVAMQMQPLKEGQNVFEINNPSFVQSRALGANSARGVKRLPFRMIY